MTPHTFLRTGSSSSNSCLKYFISTCRTGQTEPMFLESSWDVVWHPRICGGGATVVVAELHKRRAKLNYPHDLTHGVGVAQPLVATEPRYTTDQYLKCLLSFGHSANCPLRFSRRPRAARERTPAPPFLISNAIIASATSATADGLAPEGASQTKKFCLQVIKKRPRKPDVADVHEWSSAATVCSGRSVSPVADKNVAKAKEFVLEK
ncbi:hypothetical protein EVAR_63104_1 [Eumeta japonica]|uniref:Uncharacterized protein n=1 Tax=Eumeta variegata TaxID=151549 RepID=A0A4C1ZH67_EUMVA|nr:hypothetical protein EVAR_63104_1 [Eumeta japonica]